MTNTEKYACHSNDAEKYACRSFGRWSMLALVIVLALGLLGWATLEQRKSIMKTASEMEGCSTFVQCVEKAGLSGVLEKDGPFSVFIPTNEAFQKLSPDQLKSLLDNKSALTALLLYHMVPKKMNTAEMENLQNCLTCTVPQTSIACSEHKYGRGNYTGANVPCTNGVIFLIDTVQIPSFLNPNDSNELASETADITVVETTGPGAATKKISVKKPVTKATEEGLSNTDAKNSNASDKSSGNDKGANASDKSSGNDKEANASDKSSGNDKEANASDKSSGNDKEANASDKSSGNDKKSESGDKEAKSDSEQEKSNDGKKSDKQ